MDAQLLETIGLTRNQSIVYMTLLRTGTARSGTILKEARLNTGKIYDILEELGHKGLVSESVIDGVRHFSAAPPTQLLEYLDQKKEELDKETSFIEQHLSELEHLRTVKKTKVKAMTYTGLRGLKTAVEEAYSLMKPGEYSVVFGVTERKPEKFNNFWKQWTPNKLLKTHGAKFLFSERGDYYKKFKSLEGTECRVLSLTTPVAIDVFGSQAVLILNYEEPSSCTLIIDENTARSFMQFFDQLWAIAEP